MKQYFYDVFICLFDKTTDINDINGRLSIIKDKNCINIQSLKGLSEKEVRDIINGCLSMERVRLNAVCIHPVYANVFELDNGNHIVVLSICKNIMKSDEVNSVLNIIFGKRKYAPFSLNGNMKNNHMESLEYWENNFAKKRLYLPRRKMPNPEAYYSEALNVSEELTRRILRCVRERKRSLKTILYLATGAIMCKVLEATRIVINDIHEGGQLSSIPIVFDSSKKRHDQYESVKRQLINAEYYDNCLTEEMWQKTSVDPAVTPMISVLFMYDGKYNEFLANMSENIVYSQPAINADYLNFCIIPRLSNDGFCISYVYSDVLFDKLIISNFHNTLTNYLEEYLFDGVGEDSINNDISIEDQLIFKSNFEIIKNSTMSKENGNSYDDTSDVNVKSEKNVTENSVREKDEYDNKTNERHNSIKLSCLKNINLFSKCSEETLKMIVEHAMIHNLGMGQSIIKIGDWSERLYIIVRGGLEGWVKGSDYYEIPVEKHSPGAMVGIESLFNNKFSQITFRSCMSDTILLSIASEDVINVAGTNPEIIGGIIENVGRILEDIKIKDAKRGQTP